MEVASPAFLDTSFVYALINSRDAYHATSVQWQQRLEREQRALVTSQFVLAEVANGLARVRFRQKAAAAISLILAHPNVEVIPASEALFEDALELFTSRHDKDWRSH